MSLNSGKMKSDKRNLLVITGGSGFVGRLLIDCLDLSDLELCVVGRDVIKLKQQYPMAMCAGYCELEMVLSKAAAVLHLAAVNNNSDSTKECFEAVNSAFLVQLAEQSVAAGVPHFVNVSSFHALDKNNLSPYAVSKRNGLCAIRNMTGMKITNLFLPAVYGKTFAGKLGFLNGVPRFVSRPMFQVLSSLAPVVHIERIKDWLVSTLEETDPQLRSGQPHISQVLLSDPKEENPTFNACKRSIDFIVGILLILGLWWLFIIVALSIRCTSSGPAIIAQERVGRFGNSFRCIKFRTMFEGTPSVGTHQISSDAVTPIGKWLRRTKLDELPQAFNLVVGSMSIVGPRPCLPSQRAVIHARERLGIHRLKPGISGLAQISNTDMSDPEALAKTDRLYLMTQSILADARIMMLTIKGNGRGDNVSP